MNTESSFSFRKQFTRIHGWVQVLCVNGLKGN